MITAVAKYEAKPGSADEVAALLQQIAVLCREEPGNHAYEISRDLEHVNRFVIFEQYDDHDALDAHRASEHFQQIAVPKILPLLESRKVLIFEGAGE